jgi:hypothetical protein
VDILDFGYAGRVIAIDTYSHPSGLEQSAQATTA